MALKSHVAQYFARLDMISLSAYLSFAAAMAVSNYKKMKERHIIEAFYGTPLMVIVHPGSLCGGYHTSHAFDPRKLRQLVDEIYGWNGECPKEGHIALTD